jgi:hypothetical protein
MRFRAVIAIAFVALLAAAGSGAAAPTKTGSILVFVTPSQGKGDGTIIIAGAIGDYGKTTTANKHGIAQVKLKQGSFEVNLSVVIKKANTAPATLVDNATCSMVFKVSGPIMFLGGTGAYKGIAGHATIDETFVAIGPRFATGAKKGLCNTSNSANAIAQWGAVTGSGMVSFAQPSA